MIHLSLSTAYKIVIGTNQFCDVFLPFFICELHIYRYKRQEGITLQKCSKDRKSILTTMIGWAKFKITKRRIF